MAQANSQQSEPESRKHDGAGTWTFWFEIACVLAAVVWIMAHCGSLWQNRQSWNGWMLIAIALAWPAADFVSGLVHWSADTWGSQDFPWLGPRFIKPFRIHHVTPSSFLECTFFDTNGDTCLVALPILAVLGLIPTSTSWGLALLAFGTFFCAFAIPTNQIHQWAHMHAPPRWVRHLQNWGVILSPAEHARHHASPYTGHYCITTGFCNRWLERIGFFARLETIVTSVTGVRPRQDELKQHHGGTAIDAEQ